MRLGGPVMEKYSTPEEWCRELKNAGYRASYCPVESSAGEDEIRSYARAAEKENIVIAEVGAWCNPLSADETEQRKAIEYCQKQLELADHIGARCCVNIAGSRGLQWDGPHQDNLSADTFDLIVETTRKIIDGVKPVKTYYTLETMPWIYPDSAQSYLQLIKAINRSQFAVHLDPVNIINSPQRYFYNKDVLRECFSILGPYIKSCHAKDIILSGKLTVHLDEARPGAGSMDYRVYLMELAKLDQDIPLMIEHLSSKEEYIGAAEYIRGIASELDIAL